MQCARTGPGLRAAGPSQGRRRLTARIPLRAVDAAKDVVSKSGLAVLGEEGQRNALSTKINPFEKKKNEKAGHLMWEEVTDLAKLVREGKTSWEDLDLDDVDMRLKWCGMFHRRKRTPGKFMMRLRIPNGIVTSSQMRFLAGMVERVDGCADVTTRANLQLRGMGIEECEEVFMGLYDIGLTSVQSGMDNVRNMTGNPIAGIDPHELIDTIPLCRAMDDMITNNRKGNPELANLPRKFNIAINATRDDFVHTHINDLAFDAVRDPKDGRVRFNVVVGGYLSIKRCAESFPLDVSLEVDQIVPFAKALLEVFREYGLRQDRQKARFIWLVEDWGVERIREMIAKQMGVSGFERAVPAAHDTPWRRRDLIGIHDQKQPGLCWVGASVPAGRITAEDMFAYADLADRYGSGELRLTVDENILIPNVPKDKVEAIKAEPIFQKHTLSPGPLMSGLVSCTGAEFCGFGLTETKMPAIETARKLEEDLDIPQPVRIHWTGCPNSCGQAQVGDIGLIGSPAKKDGKAVQGVSIIGGGTIGEGAKLASTEFEKAVPTEDVYDRLREILINEYGAKPRGPRGPVVAAMSAAPAPTVLPGGNGGTALAPTLAAPAGDLVPPPALVDRMVAAGAAKAALPADKVVVLGILAGVYIGLGALLALSVGGNAPALAASNPGLQKFLFGAIGLPMGLLLVITTGAELFTGNTAIVTMAYLRKKASLAQLASNLTLSFFANFAGCLVVAALAVAAGVPTAAAPTAVAVAKTGYATFWTPFFRGVICNWLVCSAILQATSTTSFVGRFFGVLWPIAGFVAIGLEHSVANMCFFPIAIALGAPVTWGAVWMANLIPVTLGNMVSGFLVALTLTSAYKEQ